MKFGIKELGFSKIQFNDGGENSNIATFKYIFQKAHRDNCIKYLKFNSCKNITSLGKILDNLDKLNNFALNQCNINGKPRQLLNYLDEDLDKITEMISWFADDRRILHALNLNYNNITDEGIKNSCQTFKNKEIKVNQVNVYNNKIKDKRYGDPNRLYYC